MSSSCESVRPAQPGDVIDSTAEEVCLPCEGQPAAGGGSNDGLTEGGYQEMRRVPGNWDDAELGDITTCLPDHLPEVRPEWEWVGHEQQGLHRGLTYKLCVKQASAGASSSAGNKEQGDAEKVSLLSEEESKIHIGKSLKRYVKLCAKHTSCGASSSAGNEGQGNEALWQTENDLWQTAIVYKTEKDGMDAFQAKLRRLRELDEPCANWASWYADEPDDFDNDRGCHDFSGPEDPRLTSVKVIEILKSYDRTERRKAKTTRMIALTGALIKSLASGALFRSKSTGHLELAPGVIYQGPKIGFSQPRTGFKLYEGELGYNLAHPEDKASEGEQRPQKKQRSGTSTATSSTAMPSDVVVERHGYK